MNALVQKMLDGNRRALARLLTAVEDDREGVQAALADLFSHTGRAHVIGVTGAPGTGKSTLVAALAGTYRQRGQTVGVLAVDPTSPFSGGAVLGDRIRMDKLSGDDGVFIRSMATRGSLGGLARSTRYAIWVLDAAGFDVILVETVGAGQSEVDIASTAQTTVVIEAPGLGDGVQAIKAGILEIADVLVVNKADRPGATNTVRTLRAMLELGHPTKTAFAGHHGAAANAQLPTEDAPNIMWIPPVLETVATEQQGIDALADAINQHRAHLLQHDLLTQAEHQTAVALFAEAASQALLEQLLHNLPPSTHQQLIDAIQNRELTPQQAATRALAAAAHTPDTQQQEHNTP